MAMKGLYPPIVDSYMPAFKIPGTGETKSYSVTYQLSPLNTDSEIRYVQMTIVDQSNNRSVLKTSSYPNGIRMEAFNRNYITFSAGSSGDVSIEAGKIYKVQIRFVSTKAPAPGNATAPNAQWLNTNMDYFSEWSTVCLVSFINAPVLTLTSFNQNVYQNKTTYTNVNTSPNITVIGNFSCSNDSLQGYQVSLHNGSKLIEQSPMIYNSAVNYTFNTEVINRKKYVIKIKYITKKMFSEELLYLIVPIIDSSETLIYSTIISYVNRDEDQMLIKCDINSTDKRSYRNGTVIIRRTDHLSNFSKWETVHKTNLATISSTYFWADNTVESGVWYKYGLCFEFNSGSSIRTSTMVKEDEPSLIILSGASLLGKGRILKISFDPNISLINKTQTSVTETIGGKYPIIRQNGNLKYKQLTISGLITRHMDTEQMFISKDSIYKNQTSRFEKYNSIHRINEYNDLNYERLFREEVLEFLTDGCPKLFRSATEGTILVQLTDVSLTPNSQLGRMIYSFSATAYEVDDANLENYNKYDIQNIQNPSYETLSVKYDTQPDGTIKVELVEQGIDKDGYATLNSSAFINGSGNYVLILDKKMV